MPFFVNPFKKHDVSEFPGVLVPLDQAAHRNSIAGVRRSSIASSLSRKNSEGKNEKHDDSDDGENVTVGLTIETLRAEVESDLAASELESSYDRKSKVINKAIADIGMGRYQWQLFCLCGFGWLADNLWLQALALTLPKLSVEFGVDSSNVRYTTLALFTGLCIGASFWGTASDVVGRRLAFNFTLCMAGIFGLAVGGAPTWIGAASLYACIGLGVGGNLPVDGALFLEFLPQASGNLLTLLSVFWPVGQLLSSLFAWAFIPNYSCPDDMETSECTKENNMGWRYFNLTVGALTLFMFICRFFFFHLFESPKFLLSRGRQAEAVAVVHGLAYKNKTQTWLTEQILNEIGGDPDVNNSSKLSTIEIVKRSMSKFSTQRIAPLFSNKKLGLTTCLLWFQWATIGMAYPLFNAFLPQYLENSGSDQPTATAIVYRNYAITSIVGLPGSIIACYTVDIKYIGRKGTMAIGTILTGIFVFCFTISADPNFQLVFTCLQVFTNNIMYGVLYAYTPEVFPAPNRGTGTGISSFLNRLAGLCAPIVAIQTGNSNPKAPIYASGGLFVAAFLSMLILPIETRGKQSL